jgi:hypothetical protein
VKRAPAWLLALVLVLAGCATVQPPRVAVEPAAPAAPPTEAEVRAIYDRGFERLMAALPAAASGSPLQALHQLKAFRAERVHWAELRGTRYVALEPGRTNDAWLVVVPPTSPLGQDMEYSLQVHATETLTALHVRQARISELWAGIFLVHELSHLLDRVFDLEPLGPTRKQYIEGEARAYNLELMAISEVAKGSLEREVDRLLAAWQPKSEREAAARVSGLTAAEVKALDDAVAGGPALSEPEAALRGGLYTIACVFRYAAVNNRGPGPVLEWLDEIYPRWDEQPAAQPAR